MFNYLAQPQLKYQYYSHVASPKGHPDYESFRFNEVESSIISALGSGMPRLYGVEAYGSDSLLDPFSYT